MCVTSAHTDSPFGAIRAWHTPNRLLRVFIHAKGGTFLTMVVVYDFSWASTVCGIFEVDGIKILIFCECLTSKKGLEI